MRTESAGSTGAEVLAILQFGDSFFPSGATAFSWGVESLGVDDLIRGQAEIAQVLEALVRGRWAGFDRPLMLAAHAAGLPGDASWLPTLLELEALCEAMTLSEGARSASRRLGANQLKVHAALGLPAAVAYLDHTEHAEKSATCRHLPVVQGAIGRALGLSAADCEAMSAFGPCVNVVGAAIRLGVIGHLDGQRLLSGIRPTIADEQQREPPALAEIWTAAPGLEIAAMRHEPRDARMFAN